MALVLARAPIDEVVVGVTLDRPLGPNAVDAGRYLAERPDAFARHELHEAIASGIVLGMPPTRTWLVSADESWLVQLQEDRFYANWRRRGDAKYPGFSREAGVLDFALTEFAKLQDFSAKMHNGEKPGALSLEVSKIDLLVQGKHWTDVEDLTKVLPSVAGVVGAMGKASSEVTLRWQEEAAGGTIAVSMLPARLKADPTVALLRVEFRFTGAVVDDLRSQLLGASSLLNDAFERLIPEPERSRRFA